MAPLVPRKASEVRSKFASIPNFRQQLKATMTAEEYKKLGDTPGDRVANDPTAEIFRKLKSHAVSLSDAAKSAKAMVAVAQGRFTPLREVVPELPAEIERIVHWMMRTKRESRPLDALAAAEVLTGRLDPAWGVRPQRTLAALVRRVMGATGG